MCVSFVCGCTQMSKRLSLYYPLYPVYPVCPLFLLYIGCVICYTLFIIHFVASILSICILQASILLCNRYRLPLTHLTLYILIVTLFKVKSFLALFKAPVSQWRTLYYSSSCPGALQQWFAKPCFTLT